MSDETADFLIPRILVAVDVTPAGIRVWEAGADRAAELSASFVEVINLLIPPR